MTNFIYLVVIFNRKIVNKFYIMLRGLFKIRCTLSLYNKLQYFIYIFIFKYFRVVQLYTSVVGKAIVKWYPCC